MWCWRRLGTISWTDRVGREVLHRVKEEGNILNTIKRRKVNSLDHVLRTDSFLKHVIKGKLEGRTEESGRRCKQLMDDIKEKILETERGCTRSHNVENLLWKRLWTCRKTDYGMNVSIAVTCPFVTAYFNTQRDKINPLKTKRVYFI
jgi:hypothetical protein